jgi:hypothetical protein
MTHNKFSVVCRCAMHKKYIVVCVAACYIMIILVYFWKVEPTVKRHRVCESINDTIGCSAMATHAKCKIHWSDEEIAQLRGPHDTRAPDPIIARKTFVLFFMVFDRKLELDELLYAKTSSNKYRYTDKLFVFLPYVLERCLVLKMQCIIYSDSVANVDEFQQRFPWVELAPLPAVPPWASHVCPTIHSQRLAMMYTLVRDDPRFRDAFLLMNDLDHVWHYHPALTIVDDNWNNETIATMNPGGHPSAYMFLKATAPPGKSHLLQKYLTKNNYWEMEVTGAIVWGHYDALFLWTHRLRGYFESLKFLNPLATSTPDMFFVTWINWMYYAGTPQSKKYPWYQMLHQGSLAVPPLPFTQHFYACCEPFVVKLESGRNNCIVCNKDGICHCFENLQPVTQ